MDEFGRIIGLPPYNVQSETNVNDDSKGIDQEQTTMLKVTSESIVRDNRHRAEIFEPLDEFHLPTSTVEQAENMEGITVDTYLLPYLVN